MAQVPTWLRPWSYGSCIVLCWYLALALEEFIVKVDKTNTTVQVILWKMNNALEVQFMNLYRSYIIQFQLINKYFWDSVSIVDLYTVSTGNPMIMSIFVVCSTVLCWGFQQ